jgi:excisionase family DNA binding protein
MTTPARAEVPPPKLTLTLVEVTAVTGIPRSTIFELLARGELQSFKVGRRRLVTVAELTRFLEVRGARFPQSSSATALATSATAIES